MSMTPPTPTTLTTKGIDGASTAQNDDPTEAFYSTISAKNMEPLWLKLDKLLSPMPKPIATPAVWRYKEVYPSLIEAGRLVPVEEAERRVLMLVNPTMTAPHTTDTIYGGLQTVLPGEIAPAHRHTAFALRFIIEGSKGYTAVEGQKIMMKRGDIVLTPSWRWHDHGNDGDDPVIWLDGLDLPVFSTFKLNFATMYPENKYPSEVVDRSTFQFPWAPVEEKLKEMGGVYATYHYRDATGGHLSKTLSVQAERLAAGCDSPERRETTSFIYHVMEGDGLTSIQTPGSQEPHQIEWTTRDTFAIPAWSNIMHTNTSRSDRDAYLVAINDRPMLESLGFLEKEATFGGRVE